MIRKIYIFFLLGCTIVSAYSNQYIFRENFSIQFGGGFAHPEFDTGWHMELGRSQFVAFEKNINMKYRTGFKVMQENFHTLSGWEEEVFSYLLGFNRVITKQTPILFVDKIVGVFAGINRFRWTDYHAENFKDQWQPVVLLTLGIEFPIRYSWRAGAYFEGMASKVDVPRTMDEELRRNLHGGALLTFTLSYIYY